LKPGYNDRPRVMKLRSMASKQEKKININNRFQQALNSRQRKLEKLLLLENPTLQEVKSIKKLQRRIERQLNGEWKTKKYKNKIVKRKKPVKEVKAPKDYHQYIESSFWKKRKNKYWKEHKKQCQRCSTMKFIQLHHMYYDNSLFGNEPDEHFCALCMDCHEQFHAKYGSKKDMIEDTHKFITRT